MLLTKPFYPFSSYCQVFPITLAKDPGAKIANLLFMTAELPHELVVGFLMSLVILTASYVVLNFRRRSLVPAVHWHDIIDIKRFRLYSISGFLEKVLIKGSQKGCKAVSFSNIKGSTICLWDADYIEMVNKNPGKKAFIDLMIGKICSLLIWTILLREEMAFS